MNADPQTRGKNRLLLVAMALTALVLALGVVACGDDDEDDTTAAETTEETTADTGSAETVSVTTANDGDGFTWDVEPIPTADTKTLEFTNDSDEPHVLIFARLGEGYTVDEAVKLEGEKGSATTLTKDAFAKPGETVTAEVTKPLDAGEYVLLCPLGGPGGAHIDLGQLEEFSIE